MGKKPVSARLIIGLVFSLIGAVFLISGIATFLNLRGTEAEKVGPIHMYFGVVFFAIGVVCLILEVNLRRKAKRLMETGRCIWCRIARLEPNILIRINNRHPYYAVVSRGELTAQSETYRSESFTALRGREDLIGRNVRVYVGEPPKKDYYVDITSLLE